MCVGVCFVYLWSVVYLLYQVVGLFWNGPSALITYLDAFGDVDLGGGGGVRASN